MSRTDNAITILGIFVADATFRAARPPGIGETVIGTSFALSPGGKGSNQAVAAAKAGADVTFISRLGEDAFADLARKTWANAGVKPHVINDPASYTGAASIFVDDVSGDNAITVCPGAAMEISVADIESWADVISHSRVFMTQLEQPIETAQKALEIARQSGAITILNPAPAAVLPDAIFSLCDYITPNETEARDLTGIEVVDLESARLAADALLDKGAGCAIITLGEQGVLAHDARQSIHIPAFNAGPVVETTGAGDAFNGAFATAIADGQSLLEAARFGCAVAAISVTRPGAAASMPDLAEVQELLKDL